MSAIDVMALLIIGHLLLSYRATWRSRKFYEEYSRRPKGSNSGIAPAVRFRVIVPMYNEAAIAAASVQRFVAEFADMPNVSLYFVLHTSDTSTVDALDVLRVNLKEKANFIINTTESHSKASQVNAAINAMTELGEHDILSIYDIDSIPRRRALEVIEGLIREESLKSIGAFQQTPFYPIEFHRSIFHRIAKARAIYSLHYHLAHEVPAYEATGDSPSVDMAVHLTGHGEHIPYGNLASIGGFREPSCDSSLGFAISYRGLKIIPVPVPDVGQTPGSISEIWSQGVRWYRGCDLYWRELFDAGLSVRTVAQTGFTLWNNLRWFALIPLLIVFFVIFSGTVTTSTPWLAASVLFIIGLRHYELYRAYCHFCDLCEPTVPRTKLEEWFISWLGPYLIVRVIWSFVPIWYYVQVVTGRQIRQASTKKESR